MQTEFKKSIYKPKEKFEMRHVIVGVLLIVLLLFLIFGLTDKGTSYTDGTLIINELMISNRSTIIDDDGQFSDWIEIYNSNDYSINLEGFGLSDDRKSPFKWRFPRVTIGPKQHLLIFASGKDKKEAEKGYLHTNFKLNSKGENLILSNKNGQIVDQVKIPELVSDISYGRQSEDNEKWVYFDKPTPNNDNSGTGSEQPLKDAAVIDSPVYINEVIVSNKTSIVDEDGEHSDWIEIFNSGDTPIGLKGYGLSDDKNDPLKWRFPDITINPGEYALIFASGKNRSEPNHKNIHTNFKLNSENEFLLFSNSYGQIIDRILLKEMKSNISYGRKPEGKNEWLYFTSPTPGEENSTQGFGSLAANYPVREKQLLLNEAMATNKTSITDEDGEHSDWIEIYNPTDEPINLKDYGLSNDKYDPFKWKFPDVSIAPKGYMIIFASGKNKFGGGKVHTNFKISSSGENIILCDKSRNIIDEFNTGRLEVDTSRGRKIDDNEKLVFYTKATPGAENNGTGYAGYAPEPQVSHKGGFYTQSFNLEIKSNSPSAVIHYTLDGSEPTENSPTFSGPILVDKTMVVRARTYEKDLLPSSIVTHTMFMNKKHTLATISLSTDPANLWDEYNGIYSKGYGASSEFPYVGANYWKDIEKPVHFELYEPDGKLGISQDTGIKIFGSYSRAMPQKSFSIYARDIYGVDEINYPFFPDKPITNFKSILLRTSGQDAVYTKIRDAMMAKLAMNTEVDVEAYRPAVVYINGQYWGIYNIREKISEHYLAANHGVNPDSVDIMEANSRVILGDGENYKKLISFVKGYDMSVQQNYEYVKTRMDIKNYIDYQIAEIYCANTDNGNIKFWRERTRDGKWRWILFDTDWGFFNVNHNTLYHATNPEGTGIGKMFSTALFYNLLKNQEFKQEFISRFAYHLNNTYKPERVISVIDEMAKAIEPEMPAQLQKWGGGSMEDWYERIEGLKNFAKQRPKILAKFIQRQFNLSSEDMKIFNIR